MVRDVQHCHMPNYPEVLLYVDSLIYGEVANVGLGVAHCVPTHIAKRRAEYSVSLCNVGDEAHVLATLLSHK